MSSFQLIKFDSVSKNFGPRQVLTDLTFTISQGQRLAIVGENGCGKTTLARLAAGLDQPDQGHVGVSGCTIGYLPQDSFPEQLNALSLEEALLQAQGGLHNLSKQLHALEEAMAQLSEGPALAAAMGEWDHLYNLFMERNGYAAEERARTCLSALGLNRLPMTRSLADLSGGEKRRVLLATLLLESPSLLILDEPTNHLDKQALNWLEVFLQSFKGAVLLISHDRYFLNQVANGILELSPIPPHLNYYSGNYHDYTVAKQRELAKRLEAYQQQQEDRQTLIRFLKEQTFSSKKATPSKDGNKMCYDHRGEKHINSKRKAISQAKALLEKIEEEKLEHPLPKHYVGIKFHPKPLESPVVLRLEDIQLSRGDKRLISQFSATALLGDRIILATPNGSGKSSLLHLLANRQQPESGQIQYAPSAIMGWLDQEVSIENQSLTLQDYLQQRFSLPEHELRSYLHRLALIEDRLIKQKIEHLSLGQKRRLQLLELMLSGANVLILDEPTNHLAPRILDELETALLNFPGTIIAATHDRQFAQRIGKTYWEWKE
ncbi:ribosomal protection-like ABC-F family protein [Candidatus Protochlamydia phocaeensis]|uniref:ribosomal protection-like ABC-F family protein n=1 Tax=Candidatus Protochlamydia phocaeensis TaxID=1414722 RepID=UPI00083992D6|nr:ABC-F family ATP-binding cassette domain-containing protein [Candidatus Protochlamydia phocaeensis]